MSPKKKLKDARALALKGKVDAAIALLKEIPVAELPEAGLTLMQLLAYRDDWKQVHALGLEALPDHEAAYSINAYAEAAHLFALASAKADEKGAKNFLEKLRDTLRKVADDSYALQAERALEALAAKGEGNPFDMAPETDAAGFAEAVKDLDAGPKGKPVKKDKKYWAKYFALAIAYNMPAEAWKSYQEGDPGAMFSDYLLLARQRAAAGKPAEAWKVLSAHLHEWSPVDVVQVVPLEPILWPELRGLLTADRKKEILATPKG